MARARDRRADVRNVVLDARSVIVTGTLYNTDRPYTEELPSDVARLSRYAWGAEYHPVIKSRLDALLAWMQSSSDAPFDGRAYVDTGPVQERVYAQYAGLGWIGKNTCLISPELGSWLFLSEIICTRPPPPPAPRRARGAGAGAVRVVPPLPGGLSDRRAGRGGRPRFDPVPVVPDD